MSADIEKAFLMISLAPSDREFTKFLWFKNLDLPLSGANLQITIPIIIILYILILILFYIKHIRIIGIMAMDCMVWRIT